MAKKWKLTERTRTLLTLELAIILPAAALMGFSIWNLQHIQRDKAIEAAIQRDFSYVLKIAEKKSWEKATSAVSSAREEFPTPEDGPKIKSKLEELLRKHPEFAMAILYDKKTNMMFTSTQPNHADDPDYCVYASESIKDVTMWLPMEVGEIAKHVHAMKERDEPPVGFYDGWAERNNKRVYWNVSFFMPAGVPIDSGIVGVVGFDQEYLQKTFFPGVLTAVLNSKSSALRADPNPPAMMIHQRGEYAPWVASANWDGGHSEVERQFSDTFPHLILAIKYPGTTIADIGSKFLRYNYTVLGGLSLFMIGGMLLTLRNISREMKLARLKSDFVANVSHELRTPLALIRLYAETLELGRLNAKEKYQEYFRIIREESERLTALINNILDFSRIEAGRKEYDFKETNLAELVRSTLDSYRFQIEQNGFAFEENIAADIPPVHVDREAIARSLLNLVNNALKYSKDNKFVGVSLYRSNGSVNLEVRDRGIGIAPNEQEKIFEKFYRCGDPLVHNVKGSGLGLSLVRHIARAHGGDVKVESAPDKGSKFTIALPLDPTPRTGAAVA